MKNMITLKKIKFSILLILAGFLMACEDEIHYDVTGDPINRVFVNVENNTLRNYNGYAFSLTHTPVGSFGDVIQATFPLRCTLEATESTQAKFEKDNSLIDSFNAKHNTNYKPIPDGFVELSADNLTILKGKMISSDSLTVSIPSNKYAQLTESGYVLPIRISALNTSPQTAISSNMNTVYLVIKTLSTNCYDSPLVNDMVGTLITPRTSWSATLDVPLVSGSLNQMFDGNVNSYWRVAPEAFNLVVDLQISVSGITGIRINTNRTNYDLTQVIVYSSEDGISWVNQGAPTLSLVNTYQYVKFYSPITARYLKINAIGWRSTSRIYIAEFDVYKN